VVIFDAKKPALGLEGPGAAGRPPLVHHRLAGPGLCDAPHGHGQLNPIHIHIHINTQAHIQQHEQ